MKLSVPEMSCGHCKAAIDKAITEAGGTVSVDLENRQIEVRGLDSAHTLTVLRDAGYEAQPL
ncbi:MAG: heavy-metal-associated domain-containing protein [Paracoccus sp. (in: a-proteobacteria)]